MSSARTSGPELPPPPIEPQLPGEGVHRLKDVLPGLADREVFQDVADGMDPGQLLAEARVLCFRGDGYPRVDDHTGHVLCPTGYIRNHEPLIVYLDLVHELVHVRQVLQGHRVYHFPQPYVEWPTEIEAYRVGYHEAKRLGLSDAWYWDYLAVPWVEAEDLVRLGRAIGMPDPEDLASDTDAEGARH